MHFLFIIALATGPIDQSAQEILAKTGAPSASIAVVDDGKITTRAYGTANLETKTPAPSARSSARSRIAANGRTLM